MTDVAAAADPMERAYEQALSVQRSATQHVINLLLARIGAYTAECYPEADTLVVEGSIDVEGMILRAQRVTAGGKVLDGYDADGSSSSEGWDEFCEDMDSLFLDPLAGFTYEDYLDEHEFAVPGEPVDAPEVSAEALGVAVTITTSAGSDGAVLVIVDTEFEPDGSDGGPGLRVMINDDNGFVGVPWAPAREDA